MISKQLISFKEKSSHNINILTYLITVAKHRSKHIFQERKYVFIRGNQRRPQGTVLCARPGPSRLQTPLTATGQLTGLWLGPH